MQRRTFIKTLALAGAGVAVRPALASALGGLPGTIGASRRSRLDPSRSLLLVHTDLHNHSFISGDAEGDPYKALKHIRAGGIDVACMTEHAVSGKDHGQDDCATWQDGGCRFIEGINQNDWETMAKIADAAYDPGRYRPSRTLRRVSYSWASISPRAKRSSSVRYPLPRRGRSVNRRTVHTPNQMSVPQNTTVPTIIGIIQAPPMEPPSIIVDLLR